MNTQLPELKLVESFEEDFVMDTDFVIQASDDIDFNKANDLSKEEVISPCYDYHNSLNPFKEGDIVVLDRSAKVRFSYIIGKENELGRVSAAIGNVQINVAFWDSLPSTVKNVQIRDITLAKTNKFKAKLRYRLLSIVNKITPNWYLTSPISVLYHDFIELRKIKSHTIFSKIVLKLDSFLGRYVSKK